MEPVHVRGGRRIAVAVIALLVFVPAAFLLRRAFAPTLERGSRASSPRAGALAAIPSGWTEWPAGPFGASSSAVWTGEELISLGPAAAGGSGPRAFAFEPTNGEWRPLPDPPGRERWGAWTAWTGEEALFIGGTGAGLDGLAFDPSSEAWRTISEVPHAAGLATFAVWTGDELLVWGGGSPGDPANRSGGAYDPATDSWRALADAPIALNAGDAVWTGTEMLVFGSLLDNGNIAETRTSIGAAYDPGADRWRVLPPSHLSPQAISAVWIGDRMLAWDYEVHSQTYDPATDRWSDEVRMPLEFSECYPDSAVAAGEVFAWFCGQAAIYDIASGTWTEVRGGMTEEQVNGIDLWRFTDPVAADGAFLLPAEGISFEKGEPCYGCPGSPTSFWSYRPPA
jgi:hypothetical protein